MEQKKMSRITTREMVTMAMLTSLLLVGQVGMSFLPNIEVVSLLVYIYTQVYQKRVFLIIYAFVILEGCIYGFGLWWFGYLYIWSILAIVTLIMKKRETTIVVSCIVLGAFGLSFGTLYSIQYFVAGGWGAGFSYLVAGIPYDLLHFAGNIVVGLVLYRPLRTALGMMEARNW